MNPVDVLYWRLRCFVTLLLNIPVLPLWLTWGLVVQLLTCLTTYGENEVTPFWQWPWRQQ